MKIVFALLLALTLTSAARASAPVAQFRGYTAIQKMFKARANQPGTSGFNVYKYTPDYRLLGLLGTWDAFGQEHIFRNGEPNSVSMLLWYMVLSGFADDVANQCAGESVKMNDTFRKALLAMCKWPDESAKNENALIDFWLTLMGYDAPEEEFIAWKDFFLNSTFKNRPAAEAVRAMTLALVMNPFFLLQN